MSEKVKLILKNCVRLLSFILILTLLLYGLSFILEPKNNDVDAGFVNPNANGYLSLEENSLDVLFVGNSDAYSGFSPMEMWNDYGFTSYVSGTGRQMIGESFETVKKAAQRQKLKAVVLETDGLYTSTDSFKIVARDIRRFVFDHFSVFDYHDRWKTVDMKTAFSKKQYSARFASKGQFVSGAIVPYNGGEYMKKTDKRDSINPFFVKTLDEMVKFCQKNDITLILVEVPSQSSWNMKRHNAVADYAEKNGIAFIDLNVNRDEIGFDWTKDSRDGGNHLNCYGAQKVSKYVGKYIKDNVELTDKRSDPAYESWNADFNEYKENLDSSKETNGKSSSDKSSSGSKSKKTPADSKSVETAA